MNNTYTEQYLDCAVSAKNELLREIADGIKETLNSCLTVSVELNQSLISLRPQPDENICDSGDNSLETKLKAIRRDINLLYDIILSTQRMI